MPLYFAVRRMRSPAWDPSVPMRAQAGWDAHAAFMDGLAAEDFVVLGGPLGDGHEILLIVDAAGEDAVRSRLAAAPWAHAGLLDISTVEPWTVLLSKWTP